MKDPKRDENPYETRRREDLLLLAKKRAVAFTDSYAYIPGQILCSATDDARVSPHLVQWGCKPDERTNKLLRKKKLNLRRWLCPPGASVPELVDKLRKLEWADLPVAGPNHVLGSEPRWGWGGGGAPVPAAAFAGEHYGRPSKDVVTIGVLDTGVATDTESTHPRLFERLTDTTGDLDNLDDDGDGLLDSGAGHGTFVLGVLYRLAPELRFDMEPVLGAYGLGDDLSIALGAAEITGGVVNMSFGGYTHDNMEPPALRAVLELLGPDVVLVAAAGNHGGPEPFWPAAFENVLAVAAVDTRDPKNIVPAGFTNRGPWVDVCAPGVDIHSTYVRGTWPPAESFTGFARWSGTSFAAPQVAGAIALLASHKGISAREARDATLADLSPLPGYSDMGLLYLPPTDLVYRS